MGALSEVQVLINSRLRHRSPRTAAVLPVSVCLMMVLSACGCTTISSIPVSQLPKQLLEGERKDDFIDINLPRLRQDPPEFYALGPGDVLGLHVPNVLSAGADESVLPQVHYPEDATLPPAVGSPIVVREDGTVALPFIDPVSVEGMSLVEATDAIRNAYTNSENPIARDDAQVILTMIRARTTRVLVIREEDGGKDGVTKRGTGHVVDLPAYQNDVLHALSETGGMPGTDAENQVYIYRGMMEDGMNYDNMMSNLCMENCQDPCFCNEAPVPDPPNVTKIPLRYHPSRPPTFSDEDILLSEGDIVIIRSRDRETFYSAGVLGGGEHQIPRDKDLDVVGAIAIAGGPLGSVGSGVGGVGTGGRGGGGQQQNQFCQPSQVLVIRELPCNNQIAIRIDLNKAIADKSQRILIQPGDVVMLRYTVLEELGNAALNLFQVNYFLGNGGF